MPGCVTTFRLRRAVDGGLVSEVNDPVVVSLLRNRIKYTPEVAAEAVIELTKAGRLHVEHEDGDFAAVRLEPGEPADAPTEWQRTVLDRLAARALPDVPTPLSVLTTADGDDFWDWRHAFESSLISRAERDGLIKRRLGTRETMAVVCGLTAVAAAAAPRDSASRPTAPEPA